MVKKRGVGMSLEIIVVAALALVVLIVLILIFTNKLGPFSRELESCDKANGVCVPEEECNPLSRTSHKCPEGEVCCVNLCLAQKGECLPECHENPDTDEQECNGKCPSGMVRIYTFGCNPGEVCCKSG
ncbi:hypothetical protein KY318_01415 [Candidatus Woesearchaeota archaeon]|nr:hypothetical protein [Candidatus Woesearchaeota archaeon]